MQKNNELKKALYIGTLCFFSYLAVYVMRNTLSSVTPKMLEEGFSEVYIGKASSLFFVFYAVGQLINGAIGDKVKAGYMMSTGLFMAGVINYAFAKLSLVFPDIALITYAFSGYFLAMIYGPMTKVVAENVIPVYASRCSVGYSFASFLGSPVAGIVASLFAWGVVFLVSSTAGIVMAVICFVLFCMFEKKEIVKYNRFDKKSEKKGSIKILIKHQIIKFTAVAVLTGIIRTTVVFWMPAYFSGYLGYTPDGAARLFTAATLVISFSAFIAVFVYERLKRNKDITLLIMFTLSALFFGLLFAVRVPAVNIILMIMAILFANCAASILWSVYCPSLCETGMVSGATGFLDFMSYMAAAVSSTAFANAVSTIGWKNLILIWCAVMTVGIFVFIPYSKIKIRRKK